MTVQPLVGIILGSDSDWDTAEPAAEALAQLGVAYECRVLSAHRTPHMLLEYGSQAADRGLQVLIGVAGGAAHLPGMLAAVTSLPVIGLPVPLRRLEGLDSLLSIVQMPGGVPVATVAIGNGRNAGLLAARILAVADPDLRGRLDEFRAELDAESRAKDERIRDHSRPFQEGQG